MTDADIERIARLSSRSGVFPPIEWLERRQHEDLVRLRKTSRQTPIAVPGIGEAAWDAIGQPNPPSYVDKDASIEAPKPDLPPARRRAGWWLTLLIAIAAFGAGVVFTILWKTN